MFEEYKFVGVVNLFSLYPDFLFPVYEKDNELYFHNGTVDRIIDFDPLSESAKNKVIFLDDKNYHIINFVETANYSKDSSPVYAFQESEEVILCSNPSYMFRFLVNYNTDDEILEKNITYFKEEYTSSIFEISQSGSTLLVESEKNRISDNQLPLYFAGGLKQNFSSSFEYDNHNDFILVTGLHSRHDIKNALLIETKPIGIPNLQKLNTESIYPQYWTKNYRRINAAIISHSLGFSDLVTSTSEYLHDIDWSLAHKCALLKNDLRTKSIIIDKDISDNYIFSACNPSFGKYTFASKLKKYLQNKITDFSRLRFSFDCIIKQLPPMSEFYEICIICQNSVINKDEDHLLQTINRHLLMFQAMQRKKLLDDYLVEYIQNHTNETDYIIIDKIKNTQK